MKRVLALLLAPLAACATFPATLPPPPLAYASSSASATIGFGGQAMINGLVIRPIAIVEDSRCPINVRCVWAGRLILRTELAAGARHETRDLILGTPQSVPGGTLLLVAAEPRNGDGANPDPPPASFNFELHN